VSIDRGTSRDGSFVTRRRRITPFHSRRDLLFERARASTASMSTGSQLVFDDDGAMWDDGKFTGTRSHARRVRMHVAFDAW
jgi:hypothetical protein